MEKEIKLKLNEQEIKDIKEQFYEKNKSFSIILIIITIIFAGTVIVNTIEYFFLLKQIDNIKMSWLIISSFFLFLILYNLLSGGFKRRIILSEKIHKALNDKR